MDISALQQLIGTLGFPIVCCGALFWYMIQQKNTHKEEMDKMVEAINNNTLAITKLLDKLEVK